LLEGGLQCGVVGVVQGYLFAVCVRFVAVEEPDLFRFGKRFDCQIGMGTMEVGADARGVLYDFRIFRESLRLWELAINVKDFRRLL
jgi:hypothetical protein